MDDRTAALEAQIDALTLELQSLRRLVAKPPATVSRACYGCAREGCAGGCIVDAVDAGRGNTADWEKRR